MSTQVMSEYTFTLNEDERRVLLEILTEELKEAGLEFHRTDALSAKKIVGAREAMIDALLRKVRAATPA